MEVSVVFSYFFHECGHAGMLCHLVSDVPIISCFLSFFVCFFLSFLFLKRERE